MGGIQTFLGIYLFFLSRKYVNVESVMPQWPFVILVGILIMSSVFFKKPDNTTLKNKYKLLIFSYPILLIIMGVLIFTSIPVYSYKEAIQLIEKHTGENNIKTNDFKVSNRLYYIYTKEATFIVNPWNGEFALID